MTAAPTSPGESAPVLWYVHDHGSGHLARARAVLPHLRHRAVIAAGPGVADEAGDRLDAPVVALPSDVPDAPASTIGPWHHAPSGRAVRERTLALVDAISRFGSTVAVVDVSMEVSALARLCGLRVVAVRQTGRRHDDAHRIGLSSADVVWIPQHPELESLDPVADGVDDRWHFTGAFSRFDRRPAADHAEAPAEPADPSRLALLIVGAGGSTLDVDEWRAAGAPPGWRVVIAGGAERWCERGVTSVGRIDDLAQLLGAADVVVSSAGWGAIADAAATGARLVTVPEVRPFAEQELRASALAAHGLAVVRPRWPAPGDLDGLATTVGALCPRRWDRFYDGCGAERAAALVDDQVDQAASA